MTKGQKLSAAIVFATNKHAGQFDRGGVPYILHPLKVMHYLQLHREELQCIAVLHDVVEDTNATWDDLYEIGMSERIIQAVKVLTKMPGQSLDVYKGSILSNKDAIKVKMADLRHNSDIRRLKGVTQKDIDRTAKYHQFYVELQAAQEI